MKHEKEMPRVILQWKCWKCEHQHEIKNNDFKLRDGFIDYEGQCDSCWEPVYIVWKSNSVIERSSKDTQSLLNNKTREQLWHTQ